MNRLKLWLYMLVVLGTGVAGVYLLTGELAQRSLQEVDAVLQFGVAALRTQEQIVASRVGALASLAVRDESLLEALAATPAPADPKKKAKPAPADPAAEARARKAAVEAAAEAAVQKAGAELGAELPKYTVAAASAEGLAATAPGSEPEGDRVPLEWLREAATGTPRHGYARFNDVVWYGTSVPAGSGGALVLFFPVDSAWAIALKQASTCDVTLDAGTPQLITTARADAARAVAAAAVAVPGGPVGEGRVPLIQLDAPISLAVPLLFALPPAARAQAVELSGVRRGFVVLSRPTVPYFVALARLQWTALTVVAALLVVGLLLGVLVRTEVLPQVPAEILSAADKIGRGDFAARAPTFAGALGTLSSALNRAAEAAQGAAAAPPPPDPFVMPPPPDDGGLAGLVFPPEQPVAPPPPAPVRRAPITAAPPAATPAPLEAREPTGRLDGGARLSGTAFEAAITRPPAPAPAPSGGESAFGRESFTARPAAPAPAPAPRSTTVQITTVGATAFAMPAVGAASPAAPAAPGGAGPEEDEETHWRAVHAEFLEARAACGESIDGLGFERFRPKLQKNKDALMQKYGCRTVRFQVYVKEGKAALKATPVK
jgi:hypothetical protein